MRKSFIFFSAIVLFASCRKEPNQIISQVPLPQKKEASPAKNFIPDRVVTSGPYQMAFSPLLATSIGPPELQFTVHGLNCQFDESITAKESGFEIEIDVHQLADSDGNLAYYKILIRGTNAEISPGIYLFTNNTAWFSEQIGDQVDLAWDFWLQVLSYESGYLNAIFHSSHVSDGIINNLKITKQ